MEFIGQSLRASAHRSNLKCLLSPTLSSKGGEGDVPPNRYCSHQREGFVALHVSHLPSNNRRDHPPDDIAQSQHETSNDDRQGDVALVEQVVEVQLRRKPVEDDITDDDESDSNDAKGHRSHQVAKEVLR